VILIYKVPIYFLNKISIKSFSVNNQQLFVYKNTSVIDLKIKVKINKTLLNKISAFVKSLKKISLKNYKILKMLKLSKFNNFYCVRCLHTTQLIFKVTFVFIFCYCFCCYVCCFCFCFLLCLSLVLIFVVVFVDMFVIVGFCCCC
jgi:hypothetical protein